MDQAEEDYIFGMLRNQEKARRELEEHCERVRQEFLTRQREIRKAEIYQRIFESLTIAEKIQLLFYLPPL